MLRIISGGEGCELEELGVMKGLGGAMQWTDLLREGGVDGRWG